MASVTRSTLLSSLATLWLTGFMMLLGVPDSIAVYPFAAALLLALSGTLGVLALGVRALLREA